MLVVARTIWTSATCCTLKLYQVTYAWLVITSKAERSSFRLALVCILRRTKDEARPSLSAMFKLDEIGKVEWNEYRPRRRWAINLTRKLVNFWWTLTNALPLAGYGLQDSAYIATLWSYLIGRMFRSLPRWSHKAMKGFSDFATASR